MVGWHHGLNRNKFEQTPGDGEGQGTLVCSPWGHRQSDTTQRLNNNRKYASKKKDTTNLEFCTLQNYPSKMKEKYRLESKLRELVASRAVLQEMLKKKKKFLREEENNIGQKLRST